jgi:hypothetical protein
MATVTTDEVRTCLPQLLEQARTQPIFIRDGDRDLGVLISAEGFERDQLRKVARFEATRDAMVLELEKNLAQDGMTMEQFVQELLA